MNDAPPPAERRELDRADWDWILYGEPDGGLCLLVLVGWIGVFEHEHRLDEVERERYAREGRAFLSALSARINGEQIAAARQRMAERASKL